MKITKISPNVYQLTKWIVMNAYLVRESDGFTLVDTLVSGQGEAILAAAESLDTPIRRITLTHAHVDHAGALDEIAAKLPDAEILLGTQTAQFTSGDMALMDDQPDFPLKGGFVPCQTRPTRTLAEGDPIGSLRVVASPGHSPDHLSFFDTRDRVLIAGDAFQTAGGLAVTGDLRLLFPLPAIATWHKPTALESAKKLAALEPAWLAVGHGQALANPAPALTRVIARAAR